MSVNLTMNQVSQGLHAALGALFVTFAVAFGWHDPYLWGAGLGTLYALVKEFLWDLTYETSESSGGFAGSCEDFAFYEIGIVSAIAVLTIYKWATL